MKTIYLHGLGQTACAWDAVKAQIPGDAPELFALTENITFAGLHAALEAYLEYEPEPVHLVGMSLGGMLAMRYAALHPEKVGALTLIGVTLVMPTTLVGAQNLLFGMLPERAFRGTLLTKAQTISLCASMARLDLTGEVMNIHCPMQVICGEKDRASQKSAARIAEICGCRSWTISGAGREVNLDAPDKLADAIRSL